MINEINKITDIFETLKNIINLSADLNTDINEKK